MADRRSHVDKVREQFTRQARAYAEMRQTRNERELEALAWLSGATSSHSALDVACGPGFLTMALARRCARATGLDATDELLALARREAERCSIDNVEFVSGDAEALAFDDGSFDVVSCRAAFHHFPEPARVLAEMKRVLRPGGRVLVADMLTFDDSAKAEEHNRIERLCDPTHVRALTGAELESLFAAASLRIGFHTTVSIDFDLEEWLAHGGPSDEARREIVTRMEASIEDDRSGLNVRREEGKLRFSQRGGVFVGEPYPESVR